MNTDEYRRGGEKDEKFVVCLFSVVSPGARDVQMTSPAGALAIALRRAVDNHYKEAWPVSRYVDLLATTPHLLDRAAREVFGQAIAGIHHPLCRGYRSGNWIRGSA